MTHAPCGTAVRLLLTLAPLVLSSAAPTDEPVYEGYADALTSGGAGGAEVWVTTLADDGPGSLRQAIAGLTGTPTVVKFAVAGTICVHREIRITRSSVTIAGETAPEPGITLECAYSSDRGLGINASDVIVRQLRIRNSPAENLQIWGGNRIIIDRCSLTWAGDGAVDCNTGRVTVSRCLVAGNVEGSKAHGNRVSFHHNLFTDNNRRQPRVFAPAGPDFDFRNNVVRRWWNLGTQVVGAGASCNILNNFYGPPAPGETWGASLVDQDAGPFHTSGNAASDPAAIDLNAIGTAAEPFGQPDVTTLAAEDVPADVLADVGAQPTDAVDLAWIDGSASGHRPAGWTPPPDLCTGGGGGGGPAWSEPAGWHVDAASGSDSNPGSAGLPFASIVRAIASARAGDLVLVWSGTYAGQLNFTAYAGTAGAPIRFKRDPAAGRARITSGSTANPCVYGTKGYIVLDGFEITGGQNGVRLYHDAADGWLILNCRIFGNGQDGVHVRYADGTTLENCAIYGNGSNFKGVYAYSSALNTTIRRCTIYDHRQNVYLATSATGTLQDSIVNVGLTGVTASGATLSILYSDVFGHATNYQGAAPGPGSISADPRFVAPVAGDFRLQASSPCRGAASDGGDMGVRP